MQLDKQKNICNSDKQIFKQNVHSSKVMDTNKKRDELTKIGSDKQKYLFKIRPANFHTENPAERKLFGRSILQNDI